jgi:hypothetical protein
MSPVASSASGSAGREKATYQSTSTGKGVEDQATGKAAGTGRAKSRKIMEGKRLHGGVTGELGEAT